MKISDIIYCSFLGICNFVILKEVFTYGIVNSLKQGFANPRIRAAVFFGLIFTVAGGIAHRVVDFNPNMKSSVNWFFVFILPFIGALIFKGKLDPGWSSLEHGKRMWKSLFPMLTYRDGVIQNNASKLVDHPKVIEAKRLIVSAIELAPQSNIEPLRAVSNKAIAWQELGLLHRVLNEFDEAEKAFNKSLLLLEKEGGSGSNNKHILSAYRETIYRMGELNHARVNIERARECYLASLEIDEKLGHDEPYGERATRTLLRQLEDANR